MKVGMPVWEENMAPIFDAAKRLLVVEVRDDAEVDRSTVSLGEEALSHRVELVEQLGISVLICNWISKPLAHFLEEVGTTVIHGIRGGPDVVLATYFAGEHPGPRSTMANVNREHMEPATA